MRKSQFILRNLHLNIYRMNQCQSKNDGLYKMGIQFGTFYGTVQIRSVHIHLDVVVVDFLQQYWWLLVGDGRSGHRRGTVCNRITAGWIFPFKILHILSVQLVKHGAFIVFIPNDVCEQTKMKHSYTLCCQLQFCSNSYAKDTLESVTKNIIKTFRN